MMSSKEIKTLARNPLLNEIFTVLVVLEGRYDYMTIVYEFLHVSQSVMWDVKQRELKTRAE